VPCPRSIRALSLLIATVTGSCAASPTAGSGQPGGGNPNAKLGDVINFVAGTGDVPYALGDNAYGMIGNAFLSRSALGNSSLVIGTDPGKICIQGTVDAVPAPLDGSHPPYSSYWGIEIGFDLNQGMAWMPGNVLGFAFTIEGTVMSPMRFMALPFGLDPTAEASAKCLPMNPQSGVAQQVQFAQLTQFCWSSGNPVIDTSNGLANFGLQIAADTGAAIPFDWCLKDLRPLLAP
jgi:hypothetical protein